MGKVMPEKEKKYISIGMLAHVDAGKTTLSECILYNSGAIGKQGRVDHGDAFLDNNELERRRGITVFSKQAVFETSGSVFTIIDTPGHSDFSEEMKRSLQILDYAVLIVSAPDGVTGRVLNLWKLTEKFGIPTFIFVNKTDAPDFDRERCMKEISEKLSFSCVSFDVPKDEKFYENAAAASEAAMEAFFDTGIVPDDVIAEDIRERNLFPVYFGSALRNHGVREFIEGLDRYAKESNGGTEQAAVVYKISRDEKGNRLTHIKVTGGKFAVKTLVGDEKINEIRLYSGEKYKMLDEAKNGMVCALTGLSSTYAGQHIGENAGASDGSSKPCMNYKVILEPDCDVFDATRKLKLLGEEFPELNVTNNPETGEIRMGLMGDVQMETIRELAKSRFDMDIDFGDDRIIFMETIENTVEGVGHFEPLRHYAEVHLLLEPLEAGSGIVIGTDCDSDYFSKGRQQSIVTILENNELRGVLTNSLLTDIKITVAKGREHVKHTEGGDFRQATLRALRQGLMKAKSKLLEPFYEFTIEVPEENTGKVMADIQKKSGETGQPQMSNGMAVITGTVPVSKWDDYDKILLSFTKGSGNISYSLAGYFPCHNSEEVIEEIGYDPLRDTDNPASSVFCFGGSSEIIEWNRVEDFMHLDSVLKPKKDDTPQLGRNREKNYSNEDLEAIFRQTYGSKGKTFKHAKVIKSDSGAGYRGNNKGLNNATGPMHLVVDGYNMIFAWEKLKEAAKDDLSVARDLLVEELGNYSAFTNETVVVVFDAYKQPHRTDAHEIIHGVHVIYTKEGDTADHFIEKLVLENAKNVRITVATSDRLEQMMVFGQGALRISARELEQKILDTKERIEDQLKN